MSESEIKSTGHGKLWLVFSLVVALLAVIAYLSGQLNAHRYYLVKQNRSLVVHRGAPIPFVTRPFVAHTQAERVAYAPILLTSRDSVPARQAFEDRSELDHGIFVILHQRLQSEFYGGMVPNMERVDAAMQRIKLLTGLTDQDRQDLRALAGDYAYIEAKELVDGLPQQLRRARRLCDQAETEGSGKLGDPKKLAEKIAHWSLVFSQAGLSDALPPATTRFSGPNLAPTAPALPPPPAPAPQAIQPVPNSNKIQAAPAASPSHAAAPNNAPAAAPTQPSGSSADSL